MNIVSVFIIHVKSHMQGTLHKRLQVIMSFIQTAALIKCTDCSLKLKSLKHRLNTIYLPSFIDPGPGPAQIASAGWGNREQYDPAYGCELSSGNS